MLRLESLWIDGFKNLENFNINFEEREGVTVLIGNNASGKSNILEAISAIFAGLYDDTLENLDFKFELSYKIFDDFYDFNDKLVPNQYIVVKLSKKRKVRHRIKEFNRVSFEDINKEQIYINKKKLSPNKNFPYYFPSKVIALYSGEELRLWENYYQKPYLKYNKESLNSKSYLHQLSMLYVNKYYWDIALLTMYASDMGSNTDFLKIVGVELKEFKLEVNTDLLRSFLQQKPNNEVNIFVRDLIETEDQEESDALTIAKNEILLNLDSFKKKSGYNTHVNLFNLLCIAKLPEDPKHKLITNLELIFENGTTTKDFSEGQKKQILLKLVLDILVDENSLVLFDEPDAHIHISNKKLIPKMLKEHDNVEVVLTTHSPMLAHSFDNKHLAYLENGKVKEDYNTKKELLNKLTNGLMSVSEQQILLQSHKDILIVEGKTDEVYISKALEALKESEEKYKDLDFDFLLLGGSDKDNVNKLIDLFPPKEKQTIVVFFDRDNAGKKCIKGVLDKEVDDNFSGSVKEGVYIYLYPKKDGFTQGIFEVEDYFPIETLQKFTFDTINTFQDLKQKFKKSQFANECKKSDFDKANFDGFKKLFDLILDIKKKTT
ncbi:ATP-dependent nuclease [Bathymodiolus thermophilus thioautotrophic gill symbiont]|uniref:Endonuclease GajA/Old nuclease/RecF-like AAA domain-containing protein n=1 Tax=Bathymodiolus thermophilus thioautotrophic gill symbiont TaxID=2360 RepID=A0A1J5TXP9_9GAMM|nr:AAA family ATPase [Bathymodiolus thermophilus thioautotrophic gill symbiont]OIR25530.1 hypothetical protein BGC33_06970 [Bathymodiolus thermophilus thioautotrophic gill symbiont]